MNLPYKVQLGSLSYYSQPPHNSKYKLINLPLWVSTSGGGGGLDSIAWALPEKSTYRYALK